MEIQLSNYDTVVINSSGGKDSLAMLICVVDLAKNQNYPQSQIIVSHQDLGESEWPGTGDLVKKQCSYFGVKLQVTKKQKPVALRKTEGIFDSLLEYVLRRGKWPSSKQRWCTSDFKRNPGATVVTGLSKLYTLFFKHKVLYCFGFRADESPARAKRLPFSTNDRLTTKNRTVHDWLPIHAWDTKKVWEVIKASGAPYHHAYTLGMPRLSCVFCIFSPFDALVLAGIHNPELLDKYVEVEKKIGHTFQHNKPISKVKEAIEAGYVPTKISDWKM